MGWFGNWGLRYFKKQLYKTLVVTLRLVHLLSVSIPSRFTTPPSVLPLYLKYLPGILSEFISVWKIFNILKILIVGIGLVTTR